MLFLDGLLPVSLERRHILTVLGCSDNFRTFIPGDFFAQGTGSITDDSCAVTYICKKINFDLFGRGFSPDNFTPSRFWSFLGGDDDDDESYYRDYKPMLGCVTLSKENLRKITDSNFNILSANLETFSVKFDDSFPISLFVYQNGCGVLQQDPATSLVPTFNFDGKEIFKVEYSKLFRIGPMKYALWIGCGDAPTYSQPRTRTYTQSAKKIYRFIYVDNYSAVVLNFFNFTNRAISHDVRFAPNYALYDCTFSLEDCIVKVANMKPIFLNGEAYNNFNIVFGKKLNIVHKDSSIFIGNNVIADLKNLNII